MPVSNADLKRRRLFDLAAAVGLSGVSGVKMGAETTLNAYAERFVRASKEECLDQMIFVGQGSLRRAVNEYTSHYHAARNHQGLESRLIVPTAKQANAGTDHRSARLGGTLNLYYRKAA